MRTEPRTNELRKTGISVLGDVGWGTHFCSFYETKEDLLETLVQYFKAGLESREFCIWVLSHALTVEEAKNALGQAVPDVERHLAEGALEIHSHHEWYLRGGRWDPQRVLQSWREKISHTSLNGHAGLRASGDGGWIRPKDWMAFREYEEKVDAILGNQRSLFLCTYPLSTSSGDRVFDVAHIHQLAVARRNGSWQIVETPALKEAKAEINRLNEELEQKVEERTRELAATNEALRVEIAERRLAEEAVKEADDRIRLVIDTIPTMAWSLRPDGSLDFVNQRWLDYTGLSFQDAIREPNGIVHPEDLSRVMEKWLKHISAAEPSEDELRLRRAGGEYRWFLVRTVPLFDEQGNILKWYGVSIDIEDRKQAEMQARTLIEAIPHQIWSAPADGKPDYCNERWRAYTGLGLEDIREYGWQTVLHPEERDRILKAWQESVVNGTTYEQEERHRGADGKYRWFLVRGVPMRDPEGRIIRWYGTNTDIEDHKLAEEALRKSEKLFAAFMDHMPGFAWMKDVEGRYVYVNKKESELDVYRDGAIGKTDAELWPPEIASAYRANDHRVITTRKAVQAVEPSLAKGVQNSMLVSKFPIFDQEGSVVMVAGAGVDITDRIQAGEALRESETRFRQVTENISAVFWLSNPEATLIHYVSPAYEKVWGRSCDSLYAEPNSWMDSVHPDDRADLAEDERLQSIGGRHDHNYRIVRPDGSIRWIRGRAFPVRDEAGKLIRVAGIAEDITDRKEAQERLRRNEEKFKTLFGIAPVGISVLDRQHNVIDANPALERIMRLRREELLNGMHRRRTILNPDGTPRPPHELPSERAMAENRPINDAEAGIVMENGDIIWVQISVAPLSLPEASAVVITQDITERKRAAEALEEANRQLRILSRQLFRIQEEERCHLARELHDEIGQTLTAAKINLQIIAPDVPAKITGRLEDSIQLLDGLLRQVRQLSLDLRPPLLDELGLVPTLRWLVDQQAQRAGLRVTFSTNIYGLEIDADAQTACFRVAQEAITNIIRHSGAKNVALELRWEAERLWLSVRDDGAGFDPAAVQQWATQHSHLGLMSMKERALLVHGTFEIHSAPGQGTEIRACFPLAPGACPSTAKTA